MLLATALALVAAGCGARTTGDDKARIAGSDPSDVTTKIVGASPAQEQLLRQILAGQAPTVIERVVIGPADADWGAEDPNAVSINVGYDEQEEGRGQWEGDLLAAVFASKSRDRGLPPVAALETELSSDSLLRDATDVPARKSVTREQLASAFSSAAKTSEADLVEARISKPDHLAVAVTLRVHDPASFLKHRLFKFMTSVPDPATTDYDGLYIRVIDEKGKFVWSSGRTATPSLWGGAGGVRHDLAGCDPFSVPGLLATPPPCPLD